MKSGVQAVGLVRAAVAVVVFGAFTGSAFAQEIGTEVKSNPNGYENPYNAPPPPPPTSAAPGAIVGHGSAGHMTLGMTASFGGSTTISFSGTGATTVSSSGANAGVVFFITDLIRLTLDLGGTLGIPPNGGQVVVGFGANLGIDLVFRSPSDSVRPFITAKFGIAKAVSSSSDDLVIQPQIGFGAEYFFNPSFSMNVRALIGLQDAPNTGTLAFSLFSPSVGATVYF